MNLRRFKPEDFEDVVSMYHSFVSEIYPNRKINPKYFFYRKVQEWVSTGKDIIVCTKDDELVGFSMAYRDDTSGLTEEVYCGDIAYVKPDYRKSRAAYMMYNNMHKYAMELGLKITANGRVENGIDEMIKKHFNAVPTFISFEG